MAWSDPDPDDDPRQTMTIIPAGTTIFMPDGIHQVTIQFPDADSAIVFVEWLKQLTIDSVSDGEGEGEGEGSD